MSELATSIALDLPVGASIESLRMACERGAAYAQGMAVANLQELRAVCSAYMAGYDKDYPVVSRAAHAAAFDVITYAEISRALGTRSEVDCDLLMEAGYAIKYRALDHEKAHIAQALPPNVVFYDDLVDVTVLSAPHMKAQFGASQPTEVAHGPIPTSRH